jgi:hypothetical protein
LRFSDGWASGELPPRDNRVALSIYSVPRAVDKQANVKRNWAKREATCRVRGQAIQRQDLRVKMQVQTDDMHQPVTKEENTRVYVDH